MCRHSRPQCQLRYNELLFWITWSKKNVSISHTHTNIFWSKRWPAAAAVTLETAVSHMPCAQNVVPVCNVGKDSVLAVVVVLTFTRRYKNLNLLVSYHLDYTHTHTLLCTTTMSILMDSPTKMGEWTLMLSSACNCIYVDFVHRNNNSSRCSLSRFTCYFNACCMSARDLEEMILIHFFL